MRKKSSGRQPASKNLAGNAAKSTASAAETPTKTSDAQGRPARTTAAGAKSLMKTSALGGRQQPAPRPTTTPLAPMAQPTLSRKARIQAPPAAPDRRQKIEERVAAATQELAAGITEAASAAEQLRRAMEQIASGAEQASSASQETLAVTTATAATLVQARDRAEATRRRTDRLQSLLIETSNQIGVWANNIKQNGERQAGSVAVIEQLSQQAASIGDITKTVSHVSDQTNLLALNAAIEAARAGDHGRGFAVVADEVRALAEASEKSAQETQSLATQIQSQMQAVAATIKSAATGASTEAENSQTVILALGELRKDMAVLAESSQSIATASVEAEAAAREAQRGAEIISSAAEEQAAAAAESLRSLEQQATALDESQRVTQSLASLAGEIQSFTKGDARAQELATAAEELSTAVEELSSAANQITVAVEQIRRGGQQQSAATLESSAALSQIEKIALTATDQSAKSLERTQGIGAMLAEIRVTINKLSEGVAHATEMTRQSLALIAELDSINRKVEKIVEGIAMVSIQTNMLAVSGSVEAARAGDYGKGFAVVSKDIRNLAQDSGENAGRIKDTVRTIHDQIAAVRREMELTISAADAENQKSLAVLASLGVVETDMQEISNANQQIASSAETILTSLKEAVLGAQQIAAAAEEAGSAATQAAASAKQQARGAEDLAAAIEEIASLAEDIQSRNG
jgi:methyl-accepting chemotaxis protein